MVTEEPSTIYDYQKLVNRFTTTATLNLLELLSRRNCIPTQSNGVLSQVTAMNAFVR